MRLGGPVFNSDGGPYEWVAALQRRGYRASYCPVSHEDDRETIAAYINSAHDADIMIAEVGAWSNPLSRADHTRQEAIAYCQEQLALADEVGAVCCVNIAGSRGDLWDGPDADNLTCETFDLIVETVHKIMDAVKPQRTFYTLETMPWLYPDSTESYLALLKAINRPRFAVHFDPVNLICSPQRYFSNGALIQEFVEKLGPHLVGVHLKDVVLNPNLTRTWMKSGLVWGTLTIMCSSSHCRHSDVIFRSCWNTWRGKKSTGWQPAMSEPWRPRTGSNSNWKSNPPRRNLGEDVRRWEIAC
jgi:sugar phosphate isomerase/epimerase